MRPVPVRRAAPLVPCLASLAGALLACVPLGGDSAPVRPWLLAPIAGDASADAFAATLGVALLGFPPYLGRPEIVERVGPNELRAHEFELWGEPLEGGLLRVLSVNLSLLAPGLAVVPFPWKGAEELDYQLAISVTSVEHDVPSATVVLGAGWVLRGDRPARRLAEHVRTFREPVQGGDVAAVTAAMSRAAAALSREIAADLAKLPELHASAP
jgi:uncharacterized lipoprotein YmbA